MATAEAGSPPTRRTLLLLTGLSGLLVLQQLLLPRSPVARLPVPPPLPQLTAGRWRPQPAPASLVRARGGRAVARSASRTFTLEGAGAGAGVSLTFTGLSVRSWENFQVAALTAGLPELALRGRRLLRLGGEELAVGRIGPDPAVQTCRGENGGLAVSAEALARQAASGAGDRGGGDRVLRLLGLRPQIRYSCTLMTLRLPSAPPQAAPTAGSPAETSPADPGAAACRRLARVPVPGAGGGPEAGAESAAACLAWLR